MVSFTECMVTEFIIKLSIDLNEMFLHDFFTRKAFINHNFITLLTSHLQSCLSWKNLNFGFNCTSSNSFGDGRSPINKRGIDDVGMYCMYVFESNGVNALYNV